MAHPATRRLKKERLFEGELARALPDRDRRRVEEDLRDLLAWQVDLVNWKKPRSRVDAMPFVALYARGKLCGCFGAGGKDPGERLARAFLLALHDVRFGGIPDAARADLAAEVYYARHVTPTDAVQLEAEFELGTHGLGVQRGRAAEVPVFLLPSVARDNGYGARAMLEALVRKAGIGKLEDGAFFTFEVERVVARLERLSAGTLRRRRLGSPPRKQGKGHLKKAPIADTAAAWLARLVQKDGSLLFAIDARTGVATRTGEMHHARVAAAVQALALHGGYPALVFRARERLALDAKRALAGTAIEGWPGDPAKVGGTLAHLVRAGVDAKRALLAMSESPQVLRMPWHAAQVATALERDAPRSLVLACISSLEARPWAPWTVLALSGRETAAPADALSRAVEALVASVRTEGPHRGSVNVTPVPEVAVTALTVEALRSVRPTRSVRGAILRGLAFISAWQVTADRAPAAFSLDASVGAFVGTPISSSLRADVTAHAYLALNEVRLGSP